jgi:glycosyltransferase involved in cell wall biosynthesis
MTRDILISNGFNRFQLAVAAAEMERRGRLAKMLTGAYPTPWTKRLIAALGLGAHPRAKRLLDREEEIPANRIEALAIPELVYNFRNAIPALNRRSFHQYARAAVAGVRRAYDHGARLYHYRAGFGHESVREAKRLGMVALCEYSAAHPALFGALVENGGSFPAKEHCRPADAFWADILADIELADHVLVNSQFVADGFAYMGWPAAGVSIIYRGVDQRFLDDIPARFASQKEGPLRILFAGAFKKGKGAHVLLSALRELESEDWELRIAGPIEPEVAEQYREVAGVSGKIRHLGVLHRRDLPKAMTEADLFVFPSLSEGSARVVFEALACGLPVVTTPNSGSIVRDGEHGWLVQPGDAMALSAALRFALNRRQDLPLIGAANTKRIHQRYTQSHYGDNLVALYDRLLGDAQ